LPQYGYCCYGDGAAGGAVKGAESAGIA
jgi:hypothetical protein